MCCYYNKIYYQIRSQRCTCHDSSAVVTCAKLRPAWIIRMEFRVKTIYARFELWAHTSFEKWGSGHLIPSNNDTNSHTFPNWRISVGFTCCVKFADTPLISTTLFTLVNIMYLHISQAHRQTEYILKMLKRATLVIYLRLKLGSLLCLQMA